MTGRSQVVEVVKSLVVTKWIEASDRVECFSITVNRDQVGNAREVVATSHENTVTGVAALKQNPLSGNLVGLTILALLFLSEFLCLCLLLSLGLLSELTALEKSLVLTDDAISEGVVAILGELELAAGPGLDLIPLGDVELTVLVSLLVLLEQLFDGLSVGLCLVSAGFETLLGAFFEDSQAAWVVEDFLSFCDAFVLP